jgi:hypothetical protein
MDCHSLRAREGVYLIYVLKLIGCQKKSFFFGERDWIPFRDKRSILGADCRLPKALDQVAATKTALT